MAAMIKAPYPAYRDSGIEWLDEIPEHWSINKIKYTAYINMGQSPNSEDCNQNGIGKPFLQGNAEFGKTNPTPKNFCDTAKKLAFPGDYLLSVRAPVGALNVADQIYGIGRGLCAIRPNSTTLNHRFTWYLFEVFRNQLDMVATGSTYDAVSVDQIGNALCVIPPLPEQLTIADFLDHETARIDSLIARYQQLIELLQEKRMSLIHQAVTQGLDPSAPVRDSGVEWLGRIPAHWKVKKLKRIADVSYGLTLELDRTETQGTPIISLPNVTKDGRLLLDDVPLTPLSPKQKKELLLRKGDLIFNWRNGSPDHVGKTAFFDAEGEYIHVSFLLRIRLDTEKSNPRYFQLFLVHLRNIEFFSSSKTRVNKSYNQTELRELEVLVPPLHEQNKIVAFLTNKVEEADYMVAQVHKIIGKLHEYRNSIISAAVTGKIDVRDYRRDAPTTD